MSFTKMKVFSPSVDPAAPPWELGYLGCNGLDQAVISDFENAYLYSWVDYDDGTRRLDQETDGGNRSLTYTTENTGTGQWVAAWGLGANWVYLVLKDNRICYVTDSMTYELRWAGGDALFFVEAHWSDHQFLVVELSPVPE